jgi:hypothetical protein
MSESIMSRPVDVGNTWVGGHTCGGCLRFFRMLPNMMTSWAARRAIEVSVAVSLQQSMPCPSG